MRNPAAEAILYSALWQAGVTRACQSDQHHRGDRIHMQLLTSTPGYADPIGASR